MRFCVSAFFVLLYSASSYSDTVKNTDFFFNDSNLIKIRATDGNLKPWNAFEDGDLRHAFNALVHDQPLYYTNNLDIKPGYVKSWTWDDSQKKFRIKIDTSLKFHNGVQISAYDFEFVLVKPFLTTLQTVSEKVPLSVIKGIESLKVGSHFKSGMVEGIKVIDAGTIDITILRGHTRFLYALGSQLAPLAPLNSFKEDLYTFIGLPIGCGPYKVIFSDSKSSMVRLQKVRNISGANYIEFYSEKKGYENKVDVAFGGGVTGMRKYLEDHPNEYKRVETEMPIAVSLVTFNYQTELANIRNFRKAVRAALDNERKIKGFTDHTFTDQIIPSIHYGYRAPQKTFNLKLARELFATLPKSVRNKVYKIQFHGSPLNDKLGGYYQSIVDDLTNMGMKLKYSLVEDVLIKAGDSDTLLSVYGRYIDADPLMTVSYYRPGISPDTIKSHDEFERLYKAAENAETVEEKAKYLRAISQVITDDALVIPTHQSRRYYYLSSRVKDEGIVTNFSEFDFSKLEVIQK